MPLKVLFYTHTRYVIRGVLRTYLPLQKENHITLLLCIELSGTLSLPYVYFVSQIFNRSLSY